MEFLSSRLCAVALILSAVIVAADERAGVFVDGNDVVVLEDTENLDVAETQVAVAEAPVEAGDLKQPSSWIRTTVGPRTTPLPSTSSGTSQSSMRTSSPRPQLKATVSIVQKVSNTTQRPVPPHLRPGTEPSNLDVQSPGCKFALRFLIINQSRFVCVILNSAINKDIFHFGRSNHE